MSDFFQARWTNKRPREGDDSPTTSSATLLPAAWLGTAPPSPALPTHSPSTDLDTLLAQATPVHSLLRCCFVKSSIAQAYLQHQQATPWVPFTLAKFPHSRSVMELLQQHVQKPQEVVERESTLKAHTADASEEVEGHRQGLNQEGGGGERSATASQGGEHSDCLWMVVDVETTGFGAEGHVLELAAIEVAAASSPQQDQLGNDSTEQDQSEVVVRQGGVAVLQPTGFQFHSLVNVHAAPLLVSPPLQKEGEEGRPKGKERRSYMERRAQAVHGVTDAQLHDSPNIHTVMSQFQRWCRCLRHVHQWKDDDDDTTTTDTHTQSKRRVVVVVLVAHNAAFDAPMIVRELQRTDNNTVASPAPLWQRTVCTMQLFHELFPLERKDLRSACAFFGIDVRRSASSSGDEKQQQHSALADATATAQLLRHLVAVIVDDSRC